jgi:hypothetical protein
MQRFYESRDIFIIQMLNKGSFWNCVNEIRDEISFDSIIIFSYSVTRIKVAEINGEIFQRDFK